MSFLLEEPWTVIGLGIFAELLLAVAFFKTRRGAVLVGMGGVLIAVLLLMLLEWFVVTEREAVENTIYDAAKAAQSGKAEQLLAFIAPEARQIRDQVRSYMGSVELRSVSIHTLEVRLDRGTPPMAVASFTARVSVDAKSVTLAREEYLLSMDVTLHKEGDKWLVTAYDWRLPGRP
jgi:hypothetical protein